MRRNGNNVLLFVLVLALMTVACGSAPYVPPPTAKPYTPPTLAAPAAAMPPTSYRSLVDRLAERHGFDLWLEDFRNEDGCTADACVVYRDRTDETVMQVFFEGGEVAGYGAGLSNNCSDDAMRANAYFAVELDTLMGMTKSESDCITAAPWATETKCGRFTTNAEDASADTWMITVFRFIQ